MTYDTVSDLISLICLFDNCRVSQSNLVLDWLPLSLIGSNEPQGTRTTILCKVAVQWRRWVCQMVAVGHRQYSDNVYCNTAAVSVLSPNSESPDHHSLLCFVTHKSYEWTASNFEVTAHDFVYKSLADGVSVISWLPIPKLRHFMDVNSTQLPVVRKTIAPSI